MVVALTAMNSEMETDPSSVMEHQLVERYLQAQGHTLRSVRELPETVRRPLLAAAARYASLKMTEGEPHHHASAVVTGAAAPKPL